MCKDYGIKTATEMNSKQNKGTSCELNYTISILATVRLPYISESLLSRVLRHIIPEVSHPSCLYAYGDLVAAVLRS